MENSSSELKSIHFQVIDLIDAKDQRALDKEQDYLDLIDDDVTSFLFRLQHLAITKSDPPDPSIGRKMMMSRQLTRLEKSLCYIQRRPFTIWMVKLSGKDYGEAVDILKS